MGLDLDHLGRSGRNLADTGRLIQWAAHAAHPSSTAFERLAAAVSLATLGARLIPAGGRLLKRHPLASVLVAAGFLGALYLTRAPRDAPRPRFG